MAETMYVLDTNVFAEAARRYYAFDLAPGFWQSLIHQAATNRVCSIDRVRQELERGNDDLATWATTDFAHAFLSTDEQDVIDSYREAMTWVEAQTQFFSYAKARFADGVDAWLIAFARARGYVVVTHEVYKPAIQREVPIPNVCRAMNVPYIDTFEMLRALGVRWAQS